MCRIDISPPIASHCHSTDTLFSAYTVPCYSTRRVQKSRQLPIHNSAFPSNRISSSSMLQPSFGSQPPQSNLAPIRALYRSKHTTTRPSTSIMRDSNGVSYSRPPHAFFTYTVTSILVQSSPVRPSPVLTTTAYQQRDHHDTHINLPFPAPRQPRHLLRNPHAAVLTRNLSAQPAVVIHYAICQSTDNSLVQKQGYSQE